MNGNMPFELKEIEIHPLNIKEGQLYLIEVYVRGSRTRFGFTKFTKVWYGYSGSLGWSSIQMNWEWKRADIKSYYEGSLDERQNLKEYARIWEVHRLPMPPKKEKIKDPLIKEREMQL